MVLKIIIPESIYSKIKSKLEDWDDIFMRKLVEKYLWNQLADNVGNFEWTWDQWIWNNWVPLSPPYSKIDATWISPKIIT